MSRPVELLVLADSLAFHGPARAELTTEPRLWPNVLAAALTEAGRPSTATIVGRRGWTSRDAWFALTQDPYLYSVLLPRADLVVLAVGGMDYLPALLPSHLREGIRLLRPQPVRRAATRAFRRAQPVAARLHRGRWRSLPQRLTDEYLTLAVEGIRYFHPGLPVVAITPPPHAAASYGRVLAGHQPAVRAALAWADRTGTPLLRLDEWVAGFVGRPEMNPDGLHWSWACHRLVGERAAAEFVRLLPDAGRGLPAGG